MTDLRGAALALLTQFTTVLPLCYLKGKAKLKSTSFVTFGATFPSRGRLKKDLSLATQVFF